MANAFQIAVLYFCLTVIAAIAVACALFGLKRVGEMLRATLGPVALAAFLGISGGVTVIAQKQRGGEATGVSFPRIAERQAGIVPSRSFGEAAFLPLPNAVTNEKWRKHGAYQNWMHIPATNWWARSPSGGWLDHVTAFAWCEFRPDLFTTNAWSRPFPERLSLAAEANWPVVQVDGQDVRSPSLFWHGTTPSNTLVMTWRGGLYERSNTNLVNFQAELFNDGSFDYRYADHTDHYAAMLPFDLDGDGLENSVDPDPLTAGSDAHGTNAEWYDIVCSNVFLAAAWREGVNSNAYYFVDVVVERGPVPIYFTGDRDSRLGNPVVVALAGVTNRVPLLIGIDYAVTSDTPFSVSFPFDYMHPTVTTNGVADYNVRWPLNFVFTEGVSSSNRTYAVTVEPYDPGGELEWDNAVPMRGAFSGGNCDCVLCGGYCVSFMCSSTCMCSGDCKARGRYRYEVAEFPFEGGECRCGFDDPPGDDTSDSHEPGDPPSLTITFSKQAVIFEDAYEDSPGVMKPRRSTRVRLTVDAYGGPGGGALSLTGENLGKLVAVDGDASLPYSRFLATGESYHATGLYEGVMESGTANDVTISGSLVPNGQGENIQSDAQLTVVRILLTPEIDPPKGATSGRHTYGICEFVRRFQSPSIPVVTWNPVGGGSNAVSETKYPCYRFPLNACTNPLRVELGDVFYVPRLSCIEPSGIVAREVELCTYGLPVGKAGGVGLLLAFYVTPYTVSFSEIAVEEVPCDDGSVNGYFQHVIPTNAWSHTRLAGAGVWDDVDLDNRVSGKDRVRDEAALYEELPPITPDGIETNDYSYGLDGWLDDLANPFWVACAWHVRRDRSIWEHRRDDARVLH